MSKRILIVEDDVLLAMDLAEQLEALGFDVVGPCMSVAQALSAYEEEGCDVAVLDINLGKETSEIVAKRLRAEEVPFIVASGYSNEQWPPVFLGEAAVSKPFQASALVELISAAM
jgi:DNA-binding response OmpR family regulator